MPESGRLSSSVSGGTPPYSYLWDTGDTTANLSGVPAGSYCLTVTDANGCKGVDCAITKDSLTVIVKTIDSQCAMLCDGAANAMVMGGTAPYTLSVEHWRYNSNHCTPTTRNFYSYSYRCPRMYCPVGSRYCW
ncbi:MAG: hypothetical protein R2769_11310 [Saprospiraceae bacterium]